MHPTPVPPATVQPAPTAATRTDAPAVDTGEMPPFQPLSGLVARHAAEQPEATAVVVDGQRASWRDFNAQADRIAAALQRDGLAPREAVAVCAASSIAYVALFVGALRAGLAVAPLAGSSTPAQLMGMAVDADE